jgi:hypothetical protein
MLERQRALREREREEVNNSACILSLPEGVSKLEGVLVVHAKVFRAAPRLHAAISASFYITANPMSKKNSTPVNPSIHPVDQLQKFTVFEEKKIVKK